MLSIDLGCEKRFNLLKVVIFHWPALPICIEKVRKLMTNH